MVYTFLKNSVLPPKPASRTKKANMKKPNIGKRKHIKYHQQNTAKLFNKTDAWAVFDYI